ncbi:MULTISPECIES: low-specificity L-threonine aldolase [unclassified Dyella]|uniref:low-specificity L-threonine aldolase n=1 Tax=unclassified Dyella TaxID=2634549 RepID=UPI000C81687A|nr:MULTISPECIES: low-specificity L-threonine aldolase [unclassified Dyella]MDR3444326.1 low-specificity L-threonine aldolase [Dyella sp.]PMQ06093.1 Low specificity L-threonine aldolase [Dyella sp. AD56]
MELIDLRSDTVTRPTPAMRAAMLDAAVGDDVYGEDPTVNALQERLAADLGFEAGLFVPTGTQSNLVALMSHCERGDEYLVGADAHTYKFEGGGAAVLGSIQPQPIPHDTDGSLPLDKVAAAIKPVDPHFARTRLLALENTWHGRVLPMDYLKAAHDFARERGLAIHLDGARVFNAAVACGVPVREIAKHFDSVSVCLSKGLGAPVGSVLVGSSTLIEKARRWKKVAGGGWRQAGMLAAAAQFALDHHVDRLADDHARAATLAANLSDVPGVKLLGQHTNMVFVDVPADRLRELDVHLRGAGIRISIGYLPTLRLVTHLDVDDQGVARTVAAFRRFFVG